MIGKNCVWALLAAGGSLLAAAAPAATQAAEPSAQLASATDTKVVCHRVKKPGSRTRERQCATPAQWRALRDLKIVCHWGKRTGAETKEQFCLTAAQWRDLGFRFGPWTAAGGWEGDTQPAIPTNTGVTGAYSFQR